MLDPSSLSLLEMTGRVAALGMTARAAPSDEECAIAGPAPSR